ncbi:unnamed protein product [Phaeothamnion confervicola]
MTSFAEDVQNMAALRQVLLVLDDWHGHSLSPRSGGSGGGGTKSGEADDAVTRARKRTEKAIARAAQQADVFLVISLIQRFLFFLLKKLNNLPVGATHIHGKGYTCRLWNLDLEARGGDVEDIRLSIMGVSLPRRGACVMTPMGPGRFQRYRQRTRCFIVFLDWTLADGQPVVAYLHPDAVTVLEAEIGKGCEGGGGGVRFDDSRDSSDVLTPAPAATTAVAAAAVAGGAGDRGSARRGSASSNGSGSSGGNISSGGSGNGGAEGGGVSGEGDSNRVSSWPRMAFKLLDGPWLRHPPTRGHGTEKGGGGDAATASTDGAGVAGMPNASGGTADGGGSNGVNGAKSLPPFLSLRIEGINASLRDARFSVQQTSFPRLKSGGTVAASVEGLVVEAELEPMVDTTAAAAVPPTAAAVGAEDGSGTPSTSPLSPSGQSDPPSSPPRKRWSFSRNSPCGFTHRVGCAGDGAESSAPAATWATAAAGATAVAKAPTVAGTAAVVAGAAAAAATAAPPAGSAAVATDTMASAAPPRPRGLRLTKFSVSAGRVRVEVGETVLAPLFNVAAVSFEEAIRHYAAAQVEEAARRGLATFLNVVNDLLDKNWELLARMGAGTPLGSAAAAALAGAGTLAGAVAIAGTSATAAAKAGTAAGNARDDAAVAAAAVAAATNDHNAEEARSTSLPSPPGEDAAKLQLRRQQQRRGWRRALSAGEDRLAIALALPATRGVEEEKEPRTHRSLRISFHKGMSSPLHATGDGAVTNPPPRSGSKRHGLSPDYWSRLSGSRGSSGRRDFASNGTTNAAAAATATAVGVRDGTGVEGNGDGGRGGGSGGVGSGRGEAPSDSSCETAEDVSCPVGNGLRRSGSGDSGITALTRSKNDVSSTRSLHKLASIAVQLARPLQRRPRSCSLGRGSRAASGDTSALSLQQPAALACNGHVASGGGTGSSGSCGGSSDSGGGGGGGGRSGWTLTAAMHGSDATSPQPKRPWSLR